VIIYQAYSCEFGLIRPKTQKMAHLALTVDLRAKLLRSQSLLDALYDGRNPSTKLTPKEQEQAKRQWRGEVVIYKIDKKTYSVVGFKFEHSAASLPVEGLLIDGKPCSHAQYFKVRKNIELKYPNATPMVEVLGKRKQTIFLPAELIRFHK
jgi:PAZ domain